MTSPYDSRRINVSFKIGEGSFGETGSKTIKLNGLRVFAHVQLATLPNTGPAIIRVYGLTLDQINKISVAGLVWQGRKNKVTLEAGDSSGGTVIFNGDIVEATPEFEGANSCIVIRATNANEAQLKPVEPTSFPGPTSAATALGQIAKKAEITLENNGVDTMLASPYYSGSAWRQMNKCVDAANCFATLDGVKNTLAIWPKGGTRGGSTPEISPDTGMIGYPTFQMTIITVRTVFDPGISMGIGQKIKVVSQLTAANGEWEIITVNHTLASEMPGGPWETIVTGAPVKPAGKT